MNKLLATLCALVALFAIAAADSTSEIKGRYKELVAAIKAKNASAATSLFAKDATWKMGDGSVRKRAEIDSIIKQQFTMLKVSGVAIDYKSFTPKGADVVVKSTMKLQGTVDVPARPTQDGKPGKARTAKVESVSTSNETWTKEAGKWVIKRIETLSDKFTIDGKPLGTSIG